MQGLARSVGNEIKNWQDRIAGMLKQQKGEGAKLDQQIARNLRRLGYEF